MRDVTDRRNMENRLYQSEKLKSLGELAGGVAHDFNNVLAAILGRVQLLKMQFTPPPGIREKRKSMLDLIKSLDIIERASFDGAETVRRIQEFSRRRTDDKDFTRIDINELLENVLDFTSVRWKDEAESKGIQVTIQKDFSSLPVTLGSASELREVFTNLINNALDAMMEGGTITIKTCRENNHISIHVEDTGIGIPEDKKNRIFDPFFTTKGVQSTGLGMSISYGIINRHRGTIVVDSLEGAGTTFTIKLPILTGKGEQKDTGDTLSRRKEKARVLIIDDEDEVLQLLSDILVSEDHDVAVACDGVQGVELFKKNDFDMVFTDLGMPGMSGWEVAEAVKGIKQNVPVAIITGWSVDLQEREMKGRGVDLIAFKPFEVKRVLQLVQEGMELKERFQKAC
jgi:nitrogen-specific signal transduction histidine kinase/CheY-like chemotaxis protein